MASISIQSYEIVCSYIKPDLLIAYNYIKLKIANVGFENMMSLIYIALITCQVLFQAYFIY